MLRSVLDVRVEIIQENNEEGRFYYSKEIPEYKYRSVSFLSDWANVTKKEALERWRKRIGKTQAQKIANAYATSGTKIHKANEGHEIELSKTEQKKKDNHQSLIDKISLKHQEEKILWVDPNNPIIGFGGTLDCVAAIDKSIFERHNEVSHFVIDWKNVKSIKSPDKYISYYLQIAAYIAGFNRLTNKDLAVCEGIISITTSRTHKLLYLDQRCICWYWHNFKKILEAYYLGKEFDWAEFEGICNAYYHPKDERVYNFLPKELIWKKTD